MKENTYKRSNIILIAVLTLIVIAAFAVGICLVLQRDDISPVFSDGTDSQTTADMTEQTSAIDTEYVTTEPPESETETEPLETLGADEEKQMKLDASCSDIVSWLENSVPTYRTDAESDEEGNTVAPSEEYKPRVAFYYMDLESGKSMEYNADHVFYTASIIKAPYVFYVLKEIEKAEAEDNAKGTKYDVDSIFVYTEDKFKSGSGVIQNSEFGSAYTYYDLLRLSLTESDNVAFAELRRIYGRNGFNEFSESIGVKSPQKSLYSASAREMGAYFAEIAGFLDSGTKYAEMLKGWMLDTNHRIMIPSAVSPLKAANKYGWDLEAYHDGAIVFAERPYLLIIMTELENGSGADNRFIRELAGRINTAHHEIFEASE